MKRVRGGEIRSDEGYDLKMVDPPFSGSHLLGIGLGTALLCGACTPKLHECPQQALDNFSTAMREPGATARSQTDAISGLATACPDINKSVIHGLYLQYGWKMNPDGRSTHLTGNDEVYNALMRRACLDGILAGRANHQDDDAGIYEACGFERFGILEAGETYSDDHRSAFVLYKALVESGTSHEAAHAVARVLLEC